MSHSSIDIKLKYLFAYALYSRVPSFDLKVDQACRDNNYIVYEFKLNRVAIAGK